MSSVDPGMEFRDSSVQAQGEHIDAMARRWRRALGAVFVLLTVGLWSMVLEDAVHGRRQTIASAAERDANLAIAVEHYVARVLRSTRAVHSYLGQLVVQGRPDTELSSVLADRLRANALEGLILCFPDGRLLSGGGPAPAPLSAGLCTSVLATAGEGGDAVTVWPTVGSADGRLVPVSSPVLDAAGRRMAVAVALVGSDAMLGIMRSVTLRDATWVGLSLRDGTPLAAWASEVLKPQLLPDMGAAGETASASGRLIEVGGRSYYLATRNMQPGQLHIQVASAQSDVLAEFRVRQWRTSAIALLATGVLVAMYLLLRRLNAQSLFHARELLAARASLAQANQDLDAKVQERTLQLESANRDLETFAYTLAHDVRAPLASISGFAQALEPALADTKHPKALHYLGRIQANALRMDELTSQLMALGRLGNQPLRKQTVDLSAMARNLLADLRAQDPQRRVDVRVQDGVLAHGDPSLLGQVLENLLGNAWKFTSRRSDATIELRAVEGGAAQTTFVVGDNGAGFDAETATELFQPFKRMHSQAEFAGSGVGLAAVARICERHGGRVWCESAPDAGARFYVALPRAEAA